MFVCSSHCDNLNFFLAYDGAVSKPSLAPASVVLQSCRGSAQYGRDRGNAAVISTCLFYAAFCRALPTQKQHPSCFCTPCMRGWKQFSLQNRDRLQPMGLSHPQNHTPTSLWHWGAFTAHLHQDSHQQKGSGSASSPKPPRIVGTTRKYQHLGKASTSLSPREAEWEPCSFLLASFLLLTSGKWDVTGPPGSGNSSSPSPRAPLIHLLLWPLLWQYSRCF